MTEVFLELPDDVAGAIWRHLVREDSEVEQVAFVFARDGGGTPRVFRYLEWLPVPPDGFALQSEFHLELADEVRASIIKRAHALGASLVEFHFHAGPWPAAFSGSDFMGFEEFVPHVWWRLKGKPYLAIVVARSGFDALVWLEAPDRPDRLAGIVVDGRVRRPTHLTRLKVQP